MHETVGVRPHRLVADVAGVSRRSQTTGWLARLVVPLCLLLAFAMMSPRMAQADNAESASAAVDIFVAAGNLAGLPIGKDEVVVIKELVTCAVSGTSGGDCAKNIVVATVLNQMGSNNPDIAAAAKCLVNGGAVAGCVQAAVLTQLPKEGQALAKCAIDGGNVGECAAKAALAQLLPEVQGGLPPEAVETVNCVVGGKSLANCAKDLVTAQVNAALKDAGTPPEVVATVSNMVNCVAGGSNAVACAKSAATQNLPPDVKGLATCLESGKAAQSCLADFAASKIPNATAAGVVGCMGKTGDAAQRCLADIGKGALGGAAQQAQQEAVKQALAIIAKLNVGAVATDPRAFPQTPAVLKNFTLVAEGIESGDWSKVLLGGGAQIAQIASRIIISVLLTPALTPILGPVADAMIQNNIIGFQEAWSAARRGDVVGLAEAAFKWYYGDFIQKGCAFIPKGGFKDAACGAINDAFNWIASTAGGVIKDVLNLGKEFLELIGVWNVVDNVATAVWDGVTKVIDTIGNFLGLGGGDKPKVVYICATQPKDYFANNVLGGCLASAAARTISGGSADTSGVVAECTKYYGQCSDNQGAVQANCQKMADALGAVAVKASDSIKAAANEYSKIGTALFAGQIYQENRAMGVDPGPRDLCSPNFWSDMQQIYAGHCAAKIGQYFDRNFNTRPSNNSCPIPTSQNAVAAACLNALHANSAKNVWVGPQSEYCKKQKQEDAIAAALNPCDKSKRKTLDTGGEVIQIVEPDCRPRLGSGGFDRIVTIPGELTRIPFQPGFGGVETGVFRVPTLPVGIFVPPSLSPAGRHLIEASLSSVPVLPPVSRHPVVTAPAKGGSGGSNMVRQGDGTRVKMPNRIESSRVPVLTVPPKGPGTGGTNMVRPGSAMDRLGTLNTDSGLGSVAGTAGGAQLGVRPTPRPGAAPAAPGGGKPKDPCAAPPGCGGSNMVSGSSGNSPTRPSSASSGAGTVRAPVANSPVRPSPIVVGPSPKPVKRDPEPYNATINPR